MINSEIKRYGLTRIYAAEVTGMDQADVSRVEHGRVKVSTVRLINVIRRLRKKVQATETKR